jgi:hypothetical protein
MVRSQEPYSWRRQARTAAHFVGRPHPCSPLARTAAEPSFCSGDEQQDARQLRHLFGPQARREGPLMATGGGVRYTGIDLTQPLTPAQAEFFVDALACRRLVTIAGQDLGSFSLSHFERLANHFGAVVPHPNNFRTGSAGTYADAEGRTELLPVAERRAARIGATFEPLPHDSPAVLCVSTFGGSPWSDSNGVAAQPSPPAPGDGAGFHTDVEYEREPISVSMFLVHARCACMLGKA